MLFKRYIGLASVLALGGLLILTATVANPTTLANPDEVRRAAKPELPAPLSLPEAAKLTLLDQAYLDVFNILREDNQCSGFYGGPPAIEALNELTRQLQPAYFDRSVALRMKGHTSSTANYQSGFLYRRFEKAELNINGPFYKSGSSPAQGTIPRVGNFDPNTREARATILLHEIGHMIQKSDKDWVLPNDGSDPDLSRENTQRVINVCHGQIKQLSRISFAQQLLNAQASRDANSQLAEIAPPTH